MVALLFLWALFLDLLISRVSAFRVSLLKATILSELLKLGSHGSTAEFPLRYQSHHTLLTSQLLFFLATVAEF